MCHSIGATLPCALSAIVSSKLLEMTQPPQPSQYASSATTTRLKAKTVAVVATRSARTNSLLLIYKDLLCAGIPAQVMT